MSYKYAKVKKCPDDRTWEALVLFPDTYERAEQELRFGYEYPDGTFRIVDYPEARRGYDMTSIRVPCEMCNGRTYPALIPRSIIKEQKKQARAYYTGKYL